jgi:tetratricopeptide (TPR) repeat protein
MNVTYTAATAALNALSISHLYPNVYFLGPFAQRVSFASQQRRALNLFWALEQTNTVRGRKVAVIGGGVAGLTAAAAAIACGADVWLFEAEHELCAIQRETDKRYIHPSINFWPDEPLQPITDWPFLNWHAASCREVIAEIERQWTEYFSLAAQVEMGTRIDRIVPHPKQVQLDIAKGGSRTFDIVVTTVGFGTESGLPGFPADSYWNDNDIDRKQVTKSKKIWISGAGDGGLIDCLRVCYSGFDLGRLLIRAAAELQPLSGNVKEIEASAADMEDLDKRTQFLASQYRELARRPTVNKALSGALAKGTSRPFVCLVHRSAEPFDSRTTPIHRLLFAVALEHKLVQSIRGQVKSGTEGPIFRRIDGPDEKITPAKVVIRHGAGGALDSLISSEAIAVLSSDEHKKHQDALRTRLWAPFFFEQLSTAQFPTFSRKKGQFYSDAVRILQGAIRQQGLTANVSVGVQSSNELELRITILETNATPTRSIPNRVFGIIAKEELESEISRFHGFPFGRPKQGPLSVFPGSVVSFGEDRHRHVVTCLATKYERGDVLGLCVTHLAAPPIGCAVTLTNGPVPMGAVVEVKQFDGKFVESEDADIVCVFFSINSSAAIQAAPDQRTLAGLHRDPFDLFVLEDRQVMKWGPSGKFTAGTVLAVSGVGVVHTQKGTQRLTDLIFVEGEDGQSFSRPGDSGALVVGSDSQAVGVVFAGNSRVTYLLPLAALLDRCGAQLLTSESADPAPDPQTLLELGRLRIDEGNFVEAEAVFQRAIMGFTRIFDREHPQTIAALQGLSSAYSRLGRPTEAEGLLREIIEIRERALGPDDPAVASALQALGWACGDQGKLDEAEALFRRALAIRERGSNGADTAEALRGLGWILRRKARFFEARELLQRSLETREAALGSEHVQVSDDLLELGWLSADTSDFEQAKLFFDRCLELRLRKLGREHPQTAAALHGLASVSARQGRPVEAERLLRQVLEIREGALGPGHAAVAGTLQALGWACGDQGKLNESEVLFRRALSIREKAANTADTAESLRGLGWILRRKGQIAEAQAQLERSLQLREALLGPDHIQVSDDLLELGWVRADAGDFEDAKRFFERSLQIREQKIGTEHLQTAGALQGLASVLGRLGRAADAERLFRRALSIREAALPADHPAIASSLQALGWICGDQGKLDDAENFFRRALEIREKGSNHLDTAEALRGMGSILRKQQKFEEADRLFQRALEIRQRGQ